MRYDIGQLSVGQILDQSFSLFRNRIKLFFGITAILYAPVVLLQGLASIYFTPEINPGATPQEQAAAAIEALPVSLAIGFIFLSVIFILAGPLTYAAITHAVGKEYLDQRVTIKESIGIAFSKLGAVLYTSILYVIFVVLGLLLLIVPGIYLMFKYYIAQQIVVLENRKGMDALKRSGFLMKGNMGTAFVLGFLLFLLSAGSGAISQIIPLPVVSVVIGTIVQTALVAIWTIALVILYFHARCKHEGYDLQILAESVGTDTPDSLPAPGTLPVAE